MNWILAVSSFTVIVVSVVYILLKRRYRYWADKGVPYLEPHLIYGNAKDILVNNVAMVDYFRDLYRKFDPHKFGGFFQFQRPTLMIRDPDLIKQILVKDFAYFSDHSDRFLEKENPLSFHLFNLIGEQWKVLRAKLTPTFTSGKMKLMFYLVKECAELLDNAVQQNLSSSSSSSSSYDDATSNNGSSTGMEVELEMKELMERYGTDVISSCAFGLQVNSLEDRETQFRLMGRKVFQGTFKQKLFIMLNSISPPFRKALGLTTLDDDLVQFFINLVANTVKSRRTGGNFRRDDFMDLLIDLKQTDKINEEQKLKRGNADIKDDNKMEMTVELMAAQAFLFFVAGFETSSGVLSHCLMELSKHADVQEKLYREITEVLTKNDYNVTHDLLHQIPYLDQVIYETMRLYPSLSILIRQCTKPYRIPDTDIVIDKGVEVVIPTFGLHHDSKYFDNPEEFDPDNFTEENKSKRHTYTYLPFGEGPRMCIGLRFGLMQVKLGLITLVSRYIFEISPSMSFPVKFKPKTPVTSIIGGIRLICRRR